MKRQLIVFKVGTGEFAVDILTVREITPMQEITPVPETPDYVAGVLNLRGSLVPIIDLGRKMGVDRRTVSDETRIIIARTDDKPVGLIVDRATDFIRVEDRQIEPAPQMMTEIGAAYVTGVLRLEARLVALIDLKKALGEVVTGELDQVMNLAHAAAGDEKQAIAQG
jgi:purine-binding chemotaxis protein CheW